MLKIVADDKIPFLRGVLEPFAKVEYLPGAEISARTVADADALITRTRTRCDRKLLAGSSVRLVATATIGYDHFALDDLTELGIGWANAPGCNSGSVAQYVSSVLTLLDSRPLAGRTLSVIGVGNVGKKVAAIGKMLGMRVLLNDPPRAEAEGPDGFVSLEQAVTEADVLTMHVPLVRQGKYPTFHLADETLFGKMKPEAFFINSSRGEVADNTALKQLLRTGKLGGAVLDVWENEPQIDRELLGLLRFGTPHIAGYSADGKANGTSLAVRAVAAALGIEELRDFQVRGCPEPERSRLELPGGISEEEAIKMALTFSYDPGYDDALLRADPAGFEQQRGNYRLRREAPAFTLVNAPVQLAQLGFRLEQPAPFFWHDRRLTAEISGDRAILTNQSSERLSVELTASPALDRVRFCNESGEGISDFVWFERRKLGLEFLPHQRLLLELLFRR